MTVSIEGAIEAIRGIMPETAAYLASGDRAQIAAAMINATGGMSSRGWEPEQAKEMIANLRSANPEAFATFQEYLRQNFGQPGFEAGLYDEYIMSL